MSLIHTVASEFARAIETQPSLSAQDYIEAALLKFARALLDSRDRQVLLGAINEYENEEDDAE